MHYLQSKIHKFLRSLPYAYVREGFYVLTVIAFLCNMRATLCTEPYHAPDDDRKQPRARAPRRAREDHSRTGRGAPGGTRRAAAQARVRGDAVERQPRFARTRRRQTRR